MAAGPQVVRRAGWEWATYLAFKEVPRESQEKVGREAGRAGLDEGCLTISTRSSGSVPKRIPRQPVVEQHRGGMK